jgi:hypothetical protein
MAKSKDVKATPITIFSITDNGNGDICIEFSKEKVVEFKSFINQVFKDDKKYFDEQLEHQPPFENC